MARRLVPAADRILRNHDLDVLTGISRTTRWRLEQAGDFPARRRISSMAVGWIESEVLAWLEARENATGRMIGRNNPMRQSEATA